MRDHFQVERCPDTLLLGYQVKSAFREYNLPSHPSDNPVVEGSRGAGVSGAAGGLPLP